MSFEKKLYNLNAEFKYGKVDSLQLVLIPTPWLFCTRYTGIGSNKVKLDLLVLMTHQINDLKAYIGALRISELGFEAQMKSPRF